MIFFLTFRVVGSATAFLYPGYASYKTLSQRPSSEEDIERWLMYWAVLGCIVGVEYVAEWLVFWLPLYYPLKTLFLLYLALPQTRGASYLYTQHLQPFLHTHEAQIDAALAAARARARAFLQAQLRGLWGHVAGVLALGPPPAGSPQPSPSPSSSSPRGDGAEGGAGQLAARLWQVYGQGWLAGGAALLRQVSAPAPAPDATRAPAAGRRGDVGVEVGSSSNRARPVRTVSVAERRRQLEAELARLAQVPDGMYDGDEGGDEDEGEGEDDAEEEGVDAERQALLMGHLKGYTTGAADMWGSSSVAANARSRGSSSGSDLRERLGAASRFEEVVPSDVEGYDVGGSAAGTGGEDGGGRRGGSGEQQRRSSWFGWGASGGSGGSGGRAYKAE